MYLLSAAASVQTLSSNQELSSLLKFNLSAQEVATSAVMPVVLPAGTIVTVTVPSLVRLQVLSVKSEQPVDVSLMNDVNTQPIFTSFPSKLFMVVEPAGRVFNHIKLRATVSTRCELVVAGLVT